MSIGGKLEGRSRGTSLFPRLLRSQRNRV